MQIEIFRHLLTLELWRVEETVESYVNAIDPMRGKHFAIKPIPHS